MSKNQKETMERLLADHQMFHSDFQISEFILNGDACGNVYGMYRQCLRELDKRKRVLRQLYIERERKMLDLSDIKAQSTMPMGKRVKTLAHLALDARELELQLEDLQAHIKDTEREFQNFFTYAIRLKEELGELTPARRDELDREMWAHRAKVMAALDLLTVRHFQEKTFRMINSFPSHQRDSLVSWMGDGEAVEGWFASLPAIEDVIETKTIEYVNPQRMIE